ncbi:MAG: SMP-30/gluconolactonase/LRE family protein [Nitrospinae bacterium]|nr:SMP-30/gluconolactonase/LRE family protein [Nitrospinota bacterium]
MRTVRLFSFIFILLIIFSESVSAFEVQGLKTPESFIADPSTGNYFISNINGGGPGGKDDDGFITKLDKDGKIINLTFIDGRNKDITLNAPKGLDIIGNVLYVTDIDFVRGFDKETGKLLYDLDFKAFNASSLNDLTHDSQGNLYVSDWIGNFIFKVETRNNHKVSVVAKGNTLGGPNGLNIHPKTNKLINVTWETGKVQEIDSSGSVKILVEDKRFKTLDGIDFDNNGNMFVSSFTGGEVYKITPDLKVDVFLKGLTSPADINIDKKNNLLLIPSFEGNSAKTAVIK